jgi:hypothetical protein
VRPPAVDPQCPSLARPNNTVAFHRDRARLGWDSDESTLTPTVVAGPSFGWLWDSEPLDSAVINGTTYPPRIYASPLYVDNVVIVATTNGWVYAVSACNPGGVPAGTILWRTQLTTPAVVPGLDGGAPLGVLATPFADLDAKPPRLYVTSMDAAAGWQVFALDLSSGAVLPGWPLNINGTTLSPVNRNGPAAFQKATEMSQRAALNLSPDGSRLYFSFGGYSDQAIGWMVAVDTAQPAIAAAFSAAPSLDETAYGGMWGPGGPAIDDNGNVYTTTGNAPGGTANAPRTWGNSLLEWTPDLTLAGTYTPFNYCQLDAADIDVGGCSPILLPTGLVAFGGKQGNVYLLERDRLPGALDARPPCSTDSSSDASLLPPGPQPQFGAPGPLNVFGPYSETHGDADHAKMRSTPAYFAGADGVPRLFVSGASKASADSSQSVAPSLVRLSVAASPAYLSIDAADPLTVFVNPGSPVVSSNGTDDPVVWVLDENASRAASLLDTSNPNPVLYAIDGTTLQELWHSPTDFIDLGGKYTTPVIAHGFVFVASDRVQAFGVRP